MAKKKKSNTWIQKAIKKPGRVRTYVKRLYGNKAFTKSGTIKLEYLKKAKAHAEKTGNTSLIRAINLAINLRKFK